MIYFLHGFPEYLAGHIKYAGMLLLSFLLISILASLCFERQFLRLVAAVTRDREAASSRVLILVMTGLASLTQFNQLLLNHHVFFEARIVTLPISTMNVAIWLFFVAVAMWLLVSPPRSDGPIFTIALAWGILIRILALSTVPWDPKISDVLFSIEKACESLLHGVNPYGETFVVGPGWSFPLMYFPLLWLPYVPFKALALDIRWFNLLAQIPLLILFRNLVISKSKLFWARLVVIFLCLMPDMIFTVSYRSMSHYWLLGAVYIWLVRRERWNLSMLAVTGLVLMRITAFTTLWIHLLYVWKRRGLRTAIEHAISTGAIFLAFFIPFSGVGLARLKYDFFGHFVEAMGANTWQFPTAALSVGGCLEVAGFTRLIMPLQVLGLLVLGAIYASSGDDSFENFGGFVVFAYSYFLWLAGFVYIYYWFQPMLMLCLVKLLNQGKTDDEDQRSPLEVRVDQGSQTAATSHDEPPAREDWDQVREFRSIHLSPCT
jgi:hypothetical protein